MVINFYKKNVYGNTLYYIADIEIRTIISALTGRATLTLSDINNLNRLGFIMNEIIAP